jgi:uncharacterized protein (DUF427 family)
VNWRRPVPDPVGPGQESVWDYPRPPAVVASAELVTVTHRGVELARTTRSWRVLETAHAPAYYIPRADVRTDLLHGSATRTVCEFKGAASYADLVLPGCEPVHDVCWWYDHPRPGYEVLTGAICFYPQRVDRCTVDGEPVQPLPSSFYGDWPTRRIAGPYKGGPGTDWW